MEDSYIEPASRSCVRGLSLFYPSSGDDRDEFLIVFNDIIDEFVFTDIAYNLDHELRSPAVLPGYRHVGSQVLGSRDGPIEQRETATGRSYRWLEPGQLIESFERVSDTRCTRVIRRRGFGQYALAEFPDRGVGIFVHRGDSPGESGSNTYYLANKKREHEPLSDLFKKLGAKLADRALIISDGSNASIRFVRKFHSTSVTGLEAFQHLRGKRRSFGGFDWTCVGYMGRRNGPTIIWELRRYLSSQDQLISNTVISNPKQSQWERT